LYDKIEKFKTMTKTLLYLTFSMFLLLFGSAGAQEVSILDKEDYQIEKIYPNPATEFVFVDILSKNYAVVQFELIDILGNTIKKWDKMELTPGRQKIRLELQRFKAGFYLLKANMDGQVAIKRIRKL
jgi:type IX secretion system substrate protein